MMKRWKKPLLIGGGVVAGLFLLLLVAAPPIIGWIAESKLPAALEEQFQAAVTVRNISFRWTGRIQMDDLRMVPKNFSDPILEVRKVDIKVDLGSAIGGSYIADVEVVAPRVLLEKGAGGKFNYEFPPKPPSTPSAPKADRKQPFVQATLRIRDGEVRVRGRGRETVYQNLTANARVDTLEKPIAYDLSLEKNSIQVKGGIDLNTLSGPATLTLDQVSLKNLTGAARAYSDVVELDGSVSGSLDYQLQGVPRFAGRGKLEIRDFAATLADQTLKLERLAFSHEGGIDEKGAGRHVITFASGKALGATITVDVSDAFHSRVAKTDLKVDADLGALAEIARGAGRLPKGMALAGLVTLRGTCDSKGPSQADLDAGKLRLAARVDLDLAGSGLELTMDGKPMKLDNVRIRHAGTLEENGTGRNAITLDSGKALHADLKVDVQDATGKSPVVSADVSASSDLGELGKLLEKLIGLKPDMAFEGAAVLKGKIDAKGADLQLTATNLVAVDTKAKKRHDIDPSIVLRLAGGWDATTKTATADVLTLSSSFATMNGKGGIVLAGETPELRDSRIELDADLEKLAGKLKSFMEQPPSLGGRATLNASAAGEQIGLTLGLKGFKYDKVGPLDASVVQKGTYRGGAFRIESGVVTSGGADLKVSGEIRHLLEARREGDLKIEAVARPVELSKWIPDLNLGGPEIRMTAELSLRPKLTKVAGKARLDGLTTKGCIVKGDLDTEVTIAETGTTGTTTLRNLEVIDDKKNVIKDPGLTIVHDIGLADGNKSVDLRKVDVASSFLRGTVTGRVLRSDPALEFQKLHLAFKYLPGKLGAVAKPWLPGTLEGAEEKALDITLDGKAASADLLAILRGTAGGIDVDLAKFTMDGLGVSGKTHLDLKDGKLASSTPLSVNKGQTDLRASLDFNAAEKKPQSALTFNARDVDANGKMGPLLEKINPIFHTSGVDAKVDGRIQSDFKMTWSGVLDPDEKDWVAAASRSLSGTGVFGAQNLNIAGSPTVAQIMSALGQGNLLQGELVGTQVRIANGRCEYENMTLRGSRKDPAVLKRDQEQLAADRQQLELDRSGLSPREHQKRGEELRAREEDLAYRYVLRFSGWVGFDKRMQLRVLMPMTPAMIRSNPNLQKYIGTSFWVDLTGTTDSPRLDVGKMVAEAARRAAEGILMDKLDDALKRLLDRKKKDEKK